MTNANNEKWVFILNPTAGNHFATSLIPIIKTKIEEQQLNASLLITEYHGHATALARESIQKGVKYLIAVGGDGTFNEVAREVTGKEEVIMGIIPAGTGNDFIQILGFPARFETKHWDLFFQKNTIGMDVGSCNNVQFFNGMGLGFDAQVASENYVDDGKVKKGGKDKYIWHILKTLLFYREKMMTVLANGSNKRSKCFINTISIGRRFAGSFYLTPKAIANDGLLDVCAIRELSLFKRLQILLKVPKGEHINDRSVHYYQTSSLEMKFDQKVPFHVDGELFFSDVFSVKILPKALQIIYNPEGNHYFEGV
jgi:diacylglycerol kinase (ATP)